MLHHPTLGEGGPADLGVQEQGRLDIRGTGVSPVESVTAKMAMPPMAGLSGVSRK